MQRSTTARVLGIVAFGSATCAAAQSLDIAEMKLRQWESDAAASVYGTGVLGGPENSCGAAPLPTTPTGPTTETTWTYSPTSGDVIRVVAWRIPCSAAESMVVVTMTPVTNGDSSFVCPSRLTLLAAGGLQTTSLNFRNDPPTISSFCGAVLQPVTAAILPTSQTPAAFDFDQGFSIVYTGFGAAGPQPLPIAAYDPTAYGQIPPNGTNAVEVQVRGAGSLFSNCVVTTVGSGANIRYNANCANEMPTKFSSFERFNY